MKTFKVFLVFGQPFFGDSRPIKIKEKNKYSVIIWLSIGIIALQMLSVLYFCVE